MKNKLFALLALSIVVVVALGCGSINPFSSKSKINTASNKTLTDKGIDVAVGEESTGVPECDEVLDMIAEMSNNPDDGYIIKATKSLFLNKFKESIRKAIEDNKNKNANSTADLAKTCTDYKKQIIKYKAEEEEKKGK